MSAIKKFSSIKKKFGSVFRYGKQFYNIKTGSDLNINAKPKVLNLNIIDSCNSKCTMCNIWKQDEALEVSPNELKTILNDPLFSELTHIGVTGGEPTLREDLPEIYSAIIDVTPNILGLSIITNAIESKKVISTIKEIKTICDQRNVKFSAMVSIDGLGKVHDNVRGVKGNFETAIYVFNTLKKELNIPTSFGCTISKINVWDADDLLYYAKSNDMYGRFRVAETINRLYNQNRGKVIRNFDEDETYNLLLFFEKLKLTYERNKIYQRTYSSIQNILKGGERLIGCPYHNNGIVLGSKGQISYCAPKSKEIGNSLNTSALELFKANFEEKERIFNEDCKNCIHDYHAPITFEESKIELKAKLNSKILNIDSEKRALKVARFLKVVPKNKHVYRVFIVGWYGTETVGDKAILGGVINHYKSKYQDNLELVVGSLYPFVSERTCKELQIDAKVVSTKTIELLRYAKSSDEIVMGGGPLMDLSDLYVPYLGFKVSKIYGNKTTVFGCGIGPLKSNKYNKTVKSILKLADDVKLRDKKSIALYNSYEFKTNAEFYGDPAKGYVENISKQTNVEQQNVLSCFLREWTFEYFHGTREVFEDQKVELEKAIAKMIIEKAEAINVDKIEFHHMHNFVIGNDDRDFSRYFVDRYFENDSRVYIHKKLSTVDSIVKTMKQSKLNICMRFHSILFAHTLNTDFIAIDYTLGGKIHAFLEDAKCLEKKISVDSLVEQYNS